MLPDSTGPRAGGSAVRDGCAAALTAVRQPPNVTSCASPRMLME
jgi:hypothetical protein